MMVTVKRILKAIGNDKLTIYRINNYHVFAYDDFDANVFETESVLMPRLNCASIYWWVRAGNDFVKKCVDKAAEKIENGDTLKGKFKCVA